MSGKLTIRNMTLGEGRPKICIPMVAQTPEGLLAELEEIRKRPFDLVGWRADYFQHADRPEAVEDMARSLRDALGDIPMIFTYRSEKEGGKTRISDLAMGETLCRIAATGLVDLVDVELSMGDDFIVEAASIAHRSGSKVMLSSRDLQRTPSGVEIIHLLTYMQQFDADISKVSFMPGSRLDVLTLMHAAAEMLEVHSDRPMIAFSLGRLGLTSRLTAEVFGSVITFGAGVGSTDQGQIAPEELLAVLETIHKTTVHAESRINPGLLELLI